MNNYIHLAKCELCGWIGPSDGLTRAGKKQQSKFDICPGCGEYKISFWDNVLNLTNRRGCLCYFARTPDQWQRIQARIEQERLSKCPLVIQKTLVS